MHLKAIELSGFKSFAMRTRLELGRGLTAIVGPNGSGKSNLADAVRWVLGEQSSRSLRGQQMGDLVFAGSSEHRAVGMAEVQLIFDNSDYKLPLTQVEVVVTRRIFRDGGSEYLLNNTRCRLRDITELFTDTGLGRAGFSIIGQGQIDAILDERPEERRAVFEEAAGIARQRQRKAEAKKRLENVAEQLLRVADMRGLLAENEASLCLQAERAAAFLRLRKELRHKELLLYFLDLMQLQGKLYSGAKELLKSEEMLLNLQNQRTILEAEMTQRREDLSRIDEAQHLGSQQLWQSRQQQERVIGEIRLIEQRMEQIAEQQRQRENESGRLSDELALATQEADRLEKASTAYHRRLAQLEQDMVWHKQQQETIEARLTALIAEQHRQRESFLRHNSAMVRAESLLEQKQAALQAALYKSAQLAKQLLELREQQDSHKRKLQQIIAEERRLQEQRKVFEAEGAALSGERTHAEHLFGKSRAEGDALREQRAALQSRGRLLQGMEEQREGYARAIQQLLAARDRGATELRGLIDVLGRVISVPAELELAIEIALGAATQYLVCSAEEDAESAIAWLKRSRAGRATFLPLSARVSTKPALLKPAADIGGLVGVASELIVCEERFRAIVQRQLGRILVLVDLPAALAYARRSGYRERLVTLEGEQIYAGGSLSGGSVPRRDTSLLARPRLLQEIRVQQAKVAERLATAQEAQRQSEERLRAIALDVDQLRERHACVEQKLRQIQEEQRRMLQEAERLQQQRQELCSLAEQEEARCQILSTESEKLSAELHEHNMTSLNWRQIEERMQLEQEEQRRRQQQEIAAIGGLQSAKEHLEQSTAESALHLQDVQRRICEHTELLGQLRNAKEQSLLREAECKEALQIAAEEIAVQELQQHTLQETLHSQAKERQLISEHIAELERRQLGLQRQEERANRLSGEARVQQARNEDEYAHVQQRLFEEHQLTLEQLLFEIEALSELWSDIVEVLPSKDRSLGQEGISSGAREVLYQALVPYRQEFAEQAQKLRLKLMELGNVNLEAIEELRQLQERLRSLDAQSEDLRLSAAELRNLMQDLERIMSKQFKDSIAEISAMFERLFQQLFGGGIASLTLSRPEAPLEGGVEIAVRLPGKKTSSLVLLSGGERALTALALLLAIMRVKSPPFCLLDEVETALDEANLERLAGMLTTLAKECQMMIITHRRATMEAAEALIGITMQTKGVSTALTVRLGDTVTYARAT